MKVVSFTCVDCIKLQMACKACQQGSKKLNCIYKMLLVNDSKK